MHESMNVSQVLRNLIYTVENGETPKVQTVLDQGISVESADNDGNSLLHIAAANGHEAIVRLLLIRGASLDRLNLYGWTPLMQAARYGHEGIVLHLINSKAEINIVNTMGVTALLAAVHGGHSKVVELLLEGGSFVDCKEICQHFMTPLMVAAQDGRDDVLRLLLRMGIPADQKHSATGWTALMIAAMTGQLPMARLLVDKGADPNRKNLLYKTALAIATECEMREVRGYLDRKTLDKPEKVDDRGINIIIAVKKGDYQKVQEILAKHNDECNATTPDGATPLMYAAITGQTKMIKLLVDNGANVNAKDYENGWTALMQATYYGKVEAAKTLLDLGADVGCRAKNNITAFDMALLINAPTNLFRLLAEHAMNNRNTSSNGGHSLPVAINSTVQLGTTMAWQNTLPSILQNDGRQAEISFAKRNSQTSAKKPSKISKWARTFRNAFKNQNKVENFESTLIVSGSNVCNNEDSSDESNFAITDTYSVTNHSAPKSRLPEEKLSVIAPPFQEFINRRHTSHAVDVTVDPKASMSASLSSSGESSASRSVVKPVKFLHGSGNAGGSNTASNSPHSSGGASEVPQSFPDILSGRDFHSQSGDRYSDTVLSKIAQMKQRRETTRCASNRKIQVSISAEQLTSLEHAHRKVHKRKGSKTESMLSSQSTGSTLTPPRTPEMHAYHQKMHFLSEDGERAYHPPNELPPHRSPDFRDDDDLADVLQKLSLESYRPIFEKEEIDMDTFLTMTNGDLSELGIQQETARHQLLNAINQISIWKQHVM